MRTVALLRHAETIPESVVRHKGDCPLDVVGWKQVDRLRQVYEDFWLSVDGVVCSDRKRALQTWQALKSALRPHISMIQDERLLTATEEDLLDIIRWTPDWIKTLLIIGHNPGLTRLAQSASPQEAILPLGTCNLAVLRGEIDSWQEVEEGIFCLLRNPLG